MIEKTFIFILFLCPLVFFHELGHFLMAKLFGVRVEVFSIGFGPKLLKKKFKGTEFAVSLIPLGGYVKLFGDDPFKKDEIPESERDVSFSFKRKWARFWIVFGGPLANFIFSLVLFWGLSFYGETVPELRLGTIKTESYFHEMGLRSGDLLVGVNGSPLFGPSDLVPGEGEIVKELKVVRNGKDIEIQNLNLKIDQFIEMYSQTFPLLRLPLFKNVKDNKIYLAVIAGSKQFLPLEMLNDASEGELELYEVSREKVESLQKLHVDESLDGQGVFEGSKENLTFSRDTSLVKTLGTKGFFPLDLEIKSISMGSPADKAGWKAEDLIVKINQTFVTSFEEMRQMVYSEKELNITLLREGQEIEVNIIPDEIEQEGKKVKILGVYGWPAFVTPKRTSTPGLPFFAAVSLSVQRTYQSVLKTIEGYKMLFTSSSALKNIGGPLSIGKVAADSFETSISYFLQIMALISINLGVINLFPIPVLDGGHIMFLFFELINRGPLSKRKLELAQHFGLSFILLLTFAALFNDFTRFF
jgi:regulator of sigma E protease